MGEGAKYYFALHTLGTDEDAQTGRIDAMRQSILLERSDVVIGEIELRLLQKQTPLYLLPAER